MAEYLEPILVYDAKTEQNPPEGRNWSEFEFFAFERKAGGGKRAKQLAALLKRCIDGSDHGKNFGIDEQLASEIKRVLTSACYLFNCASFEDGVYHDFDRQEIDRKLGRSR